MNSVLRIALAFFTVVPLQSWIGGVGLVLITGGAAVAILGSGVNAGTAAFAFMLMGSVLVVLVPTFAGGVALRFASTRSMMHLRPAGRTRMLLGSTLVITLIAGLVALPSLTMELFTAAHGRSPGTRHAPALVLFMLSWPVLAVGWICIFALSRSMLAMALVGLLPMAVISVGKGLAPVIPGPGWVLVPGLACWAAFCAWYLRTDFVTRPEFPMSGGADPSDTPFGRLLSLLDPPRGAASRPQAMLQYLFGCTSLRFFVLTGAWVALIFGAVQLFTVGSLTSRTTQLLIMMPFISFFPVSLGYSTARRARFLWLRADLDRAGLFAIAERTGLRAAMATWSVACGSILVCVLIDQPQLTPTLLLFFALQAAVAVGLFYGGLSLTVGWSVRDVLLCIGLAVLVIVQGFGLQPYQAPSHGVMAGALSAAGLLALLLRSYAARRWRALDWRIAKVPRFAMGGRT